MRKIIIRFLNILVLSFLITNAIMITVHLVNKDVAVEFSKQDNEEYVNIKNDSNNEIWENIVNKINMNYEFKTEIKLCSVNNLSNNLVTDETQQNDNDISVQNELSPSFDEFVENLDVMMNILTEDEYTY